MAVGHDGGDASVGRVAVARGSFEAQDCEPGQRFGREAVDAADTVDALAVDEHDRLFAGAPGQRRDARDQVADRARAISRSEEHTSELQSLMRISYAVFCLNKKTNLQLHIYTPQHAAQNQN